MRVIKSGRQRKRQPVLQRTLKADFFEIARIESSFLDFFNILSILFQDYRMSALEHNSEEIQLIEGLVKGDRTAYRILYSNYLYRLHQFVLPFTGNDTQQTDEIVQDVFVKIWEKRTRLGHVKSFESYLFRMAKNQLIDLLKQRKARLTMQVQNSHEVYSTSAHENLVYEEYVKSAQAIIEELSPQRKRIFLMRTQNEMSIAEIATVLKISKSAVKKQLYESIHIVKKRLSKEHDWPLMWWIVWAIVPVF